MNQSIVVQWDALRTAAFGAIGAAYIPVGTPFGFAARMLILQNLTDQELIISFGLEGADVTLLTDNLALHSGGQIVLDYMSDQSSVGGSFAQPIGTQVYVKDNGVGPGTGAFYVSVVYGKED